MILYHHPFSQNSRRVVNLLNCAGLACEIRFCDLSKGEHKSPDFLAMNPNGQIPTLLDGEVSIHESMAILRHLARSRDLADWYPADARAQAEIDQWMDWTQCRFARPTGLIFFNTVVNGVVGFEAPIEEGRRLLAALTPILDEALTARDWLAGAEPSVADLGLVTCLQNLDLIGERPSTPAVDAWYDRVNALEGVRRAFDETKAMMAMFRNRAA